MPISNKPDLRHNSSHDRSSRSLTLGLINNMPDAALEATERQFLALLNAASDGIEIRVTRYMLPEIIREEAARGYLNKSYTSIEEIWDRQLDALIITGREPLTASLKDEPYWNTFAKIVDWAQSNTRSAIWSCLAAHAAILHLDGLSRVKRTDKMCGILECEKVTDHFLIAETPARFRIPHSRWNGVRESDLSGAGYRVITRSENGEIDTFIKQQGSLFVFFQGHPEYEPDTLLREYRRDISRYFKGEVAHYPSLPLNYFDSRTSDVLKAFEEKACIRRSPDLFEELSKTISQTMVTDRWKSSATGFYRNWLNFLCTQKEQSLQPKLLKPVVSRVRVSVPAISAGLATRRLSDAVTKE